MQDSYTRIRHRGPAALVEAIRQRAGSRIKRRIDAGSPLQNLGEFCDHNGWYLGFRLRGERGQHEYIKVFETRQGVAYTLIVYPHQTPFDMSRWVSGGVKPEACARLKARAERIKR